MIIKIENKIDDKREEHIIKIFFPENVQTAHIRNLKLVDDRGIAFEEIKYYEEIWFGAVAKTPATFIFKMKGFESLYDGTTFSFDARVNDEKQFTSYRFVLGDSVWNSGR